ncbi:hypothetical protein [Eubacterium uniforme]|uniref:hypothetical protein n=1 Tax=Eubacterium uniforme TaxID=39495 RepID=UPI0013565BBA|nr:hypothetical protein [Eubacterium uniforme]
MKVKNVIRKFRRMYWYQRDRGKGKKSSGRKRKKEEYIFFLNLLYGKMNMIHS